jgi:aspartate/methionine/tyrosine aminotransferase
LLLLSGWYAVPRVPATRSDEDVAAELLEAKGIYLHPGHFYEITSNGCFMVSLITPEQSFSETSRQPLGFF